MSPAEFFRVTHEHQSPEARRAEHERIKAAADERIRRLFEGQS